MATEIRDHLNEAVVAFRAEVAPVIEMFATAKSRSADAMGVKNVEELQEEHMILWGEFKKNLLRISEIAKNGRGDLESVAKDVGGMLKYTETMQEKFNDGSESQKAFISLIRNKIGSFHTILQQFSTRSIDEEMAISYLNEDIADFPAQIYS